MTAADIEPTVQAILADDWGDRRKWFEFAVAHPACRVIVADDGSGGIAGTGVATVNGPVGWIGTIWVAADQRRQGLGRALTEATIDAAESAGARTLVLVATERGRPLYEQLGFELQTWYRTMEAPARADDRAVGAEPRVRPFRPADLDAMVALDRLATGEDRAHLLAALASEGGTLVVADGDRPAEAFLVRAPWGGGATIAPSPADALALLRTRRRAAGPGRRVRCGILLDNREGADVLERAGWTEAWRAPRLIRGAPLDWHPDMIWGQFNHALG
jgi:GNAT superfamily N-acetyltransferase